MDFPKGLWHDWVMTGSFAMVFKRYYQPLVNIMC